MLVVKVQLLKAFGNNGWQNTWNWEFPTHMRSTPTTQARNNTTGTAEEKLHWLMLVVI